MNRYGGWRAWRLALIITALLGLAVPPAIAAEDGAAGERADDAGASEPAADKPADATGPTTQAETADPETPDVFVPTEEISEDFAVSFPVDI